MAGLIPAIQFFGAARLSRRGLPATSAGTTINNRCRRCHTRLEQLFAVTVALPRRRQSPAQRGLRLTTFKPRANLERSLDCRGASRISRHQRRMPRTTRVTFAAYCVCRCRPIILPCTNSCRGASKSVEARPRHGAKSPRFFCVRKARSNRTARRLLGLGSLVSRDYVSIPAGY
jgi:hypothetical protein